MKSSTIRTSGVLMGLGAVIWFAARVLVGPQPDDMLNTTEVAAGAPFQVGLIAMLLVIRATDGAGSGRGGRFVVNAGLVFVALAMLWTVFALVALGLTGDPVEVAALHDNLAVAALDAFWPLSMAWIIVVGVAVLRARTWPMPARVLPLAASFLIPAHIVAEVIGLGEWGSWAGPILYLAIAYSLLGAAVIRQVAPLGTDEAGAADGALRQQPV